jgi:hypothetical protein
VRQESGATLGKKPRGSIVTQVAFHCPSNPRGRAPGFALVHLAGYRLSKHGLEWTSAGIGFGDRKVLPGHKPDHVTPHHCTPETGALSAASDRVCGVGARKSQARSPVYAQQAALSA